MNRSALEHLFPGRRLTACLAGLLAAVLVTGCVTPTGDPRITYHRATDPEPITGASVAGEWILYPGNATAPDRTVTVEAGEPLGFRRKADGSVVAVAGQQEFDLKPVLVDEYYWKLGRKKGE